MEKGPEAQVSLGKLHCPVCLNVYKAPKTLPCLHTLCETCLKSHLIKLEEKGLSQQFDFACPVCHKLAPPPRQLGNISSTWDMHNLTRVLSRPTMLTKNGEVARSLCEPCQMEGKSNPAKKFCTECQEYLCSECSSFHNRFKATRDHTIRDSESETEYPTSVQEDLNQVCQFHLDETVQYFCKDDSSIACPKCALVFHKSCRNIVNISEAAAGVRSVKETNVLSDKLTTLIAKTKRLNKYGEKNTFELERQVHDLPKRVKCIRAKMNILIDDLENICTESESLLNEETARAKERSIRCRKLLAALESSEALLSSILQTGSETQIFIVAKRTEEHINQYEKTLAEEKERAKAMKLKVQIVEELEQILESKDGRNSVLFEDVSQDGGQRRRHPSSYLSHSLTDDSGEWPSGGGAVSKGFRDKNHQPRPLNECIAQCIGVLQVETPYKDETPWYTGAVCLPDNRIVLVDGCNSRLYLLDKTFSYLEDMKLDGDPRKVTALDETRIAVSLPWNKKILLISVVESFVLLSSIETRLPCYGLSLVKEDVLAVSWEIGYMRFAFGTINLEGDELSYEERDGTGRKFKSYFHLAIDCTKSKVLQPCDADNALYCFDLDGKAVFMYSHQELKFPRDVCVDMENNIYVCGRKSNNIHQLSSDGELIRIITANRLSLPYSVTFLNNGRDFFVTSDALNERKTILRFAFR